MMDVQQLIDAVQEPWYNQTPRRVVPIRSAVIMIEKAGVVPTGD
jgi:hypothetical protein